jgi:hypothetical protein
VIIAQAEEQRGRVEHYYARLDAIVVPNFIPAPTERIDKSGMKQVLWVANFKRWKRPEAFVGLAEKLRRLENVRFMMIGKPSNDRQWLSSLRDRIANTKALTHLGEVSQDIVNEYLAKSHLFVNTSEVAGSQTLLSRPGSGRRRSASLDAALTEFSAAKAWELRVAAREAADGRRGVIEETTCGGQRWARAQAHATTHHSISNAGRLVQILLRSYKSHACRLRLLQIQ